MVRERRCKNCHDLIQIRPQNPNQKYCSKRECQRARKAQWQRNKLKNDKAYRDNQREAGRKWRERNPDYWRNYRKRNPDYVRRNRLQQKVRNHRKRGRDDASDLIAKMDASNPKKYIRSGCYELVPIGAEVANMDASIVEINVLSGGYG